MIADAAVGLVPRDVGQCPRVGETRNRGASNAGIRIVFGEGSECGLLGGVGLVHGLDPDVRVDVRVLGLGTKLVENAHVVFQTTTAPTI